MRKRTRARLFSMFLVLGLLLAACGDDGAEETTDETTDEATDEAAGETDAEGSEDADGGSDPDPEAVDPEASEPAVDEETVVVAIGSDIANPDFAKYGGILDQQQLLNIFDTFTIIGREGEVQPMIATEWERTDESTWTITIRDDVTFHNGEPMTAEDAAFSFNRLIAEDFAYPIQTYVRGIENVEVVDDTTLQVNLNDPTTMAAAMLDYAMTKIPIAPQAVIEEIGEDAYTEAPIGTGPYQFVEWLPQDRLVLEAFPDYWAGEAPIQNVILRPITEGASRTAALRSGEVDVAMPVGIEEVEVIEEDPSLKILEVFGLQRQRLVLDTERFEPFSDVRVREALNHAIDWESIISELLGGHAQRLPGIIVPLEAGWDEEKEPYEYDPELARELLVEAGYEDGFQVDMAVRTGQPKIEEVGAAIVGYLAEVGIDANMSLISSADYAVASREKTLAPMAVSIWTSGLFNSAHFFDIVTRCEGGSPVHAGFYCNPEIDENVDEAFALWGTDQEAAIEALQEAERIFIEDAGHVFMYLNGQLYGMKSGLDWEPRPSGFNWMYEANWS